MQKVIAKIHLKSIRRNAETFVKLTGKKICAVVKANAYGHGAEEVTFALQGVVDCFAVSLLEEARAIRVAACGKDILILTPPHLEEEIIECARNGFIVTIPNLWTARLALYVCERYCLSLRVHLKTNTGMNRYGTDICSLGKICKLFSKSERIRVEGMYSHLYGNTRVQAEEQRALFLKMLAVYRRYFKDGTFHLSATYGALLGQEFVFDMTRIGIGLYGYFPDGAKDINLSNVHLEKGMEVYATSMGSRRLRFGGAGYGNPLPGLLREEIQYLSVHRFGYADGFLRKKENGVVGAEKNLNALCMDASVRKGRTARGKRVPVMTNAAETAKAAGTISYEVLCAATRRAEFIYDYE